MFWLQTMPTHTNTYTDAGLERCDAGNGEESLFLYLNLNIAFVEHEFFLLL